MAAIKIDHYPTLFIKLKKITRRAKPSQIINITSFIKTSSSQPNQFNPLNTTNITKAINPLNKAKININIVFKILKLQFIKKTSRINQKKWKRKTHSNPKNKVIELDYLKSQKWVKKWKKYTSIKSISFIFFIKIKRKWDKWLPTSTLIKKFSIIIFTPNNTTTNLAKSIIKAKNRKTVIIKKYILIIIS